MRKYLAILCICAALAGCATPPPKKDIPPAVSTAAIKSSLQETQKKIDEAGASSTKIAKHVDTAIDLLDQLNELLDQLDKEQANSKLVKPIIK